MLLSGRRRGKKKEEARVAIECAVAAENRFHGSFRAAFLPSRLVT